MTSEITVTKEQIPNLLEELETAFYDIPFENSRYQNEKFVLAAQLTPGRAYRALGLKIFAKIRAIKETIAARQLSDIDIEENEYKMQLPETSDFERRRLAIKNTQIRESYKWTDKLFNDAMSEVGYLYAEFKRYPQYTREQFEHEEAIHFQLCLEQQQKTGGGALESLANMNLNSPLLNNMLNDPSQLTNLLDMADQNFLQIEKSPVSLEHIIKSATQISN